MSKSTKYDVSQLVVASSAADSVIKMLERFGIDGADPVDTDETLGLVLIQFELPRKWRPKDWEDGNHKFAAPKDALDRVLVHLRHSFAIQFRGWAPAMGKNRPLGGVSSANGQFGGGGANVPSNGQFGGGAATAIAGSDTGEPTPADGHMYTPANAGFGDQRLEGDAGQGVSIAVLDTALWDAPQLEGIASAQTYLAHDGPFRYLEGHATYIDGLIAKKAPGVKLLNTAVLTGPECTADAWAVAKGMVKLVGGDAQVLNLSLGCFTDDNRPPFVLRRAVEAVSPQMVIVAAAGNHREPNNPQPFWPAALDNVLAVGAYDATQGNYPTAVFSPRAPWVDVEAPGVDVISLYLTGEVNGFKGGKTQPFDGAAKWEGTSASAATVSGVIAAHVTKDTTARDIARKMRSESVDVVRPY